MSTSGTSSTSRVATTNRLDGELVVFTLITTAGSRSLWAYVPVSPDAARVIESEHQFATEDQFNNLLESCFADREAVFAAAENFVISTKSDGIRIPSYRHALITAGTRWYLERSAALNAGLRKNLEAAREADDTDGLVRTAQGALTSLPA
jgi:hypothetical protein